MHYGFDGAAMLPKQIHHCAGVANVDLVMFVTANVRDQIVARFFGGSFSAEKLCTHVVVDPDDARAVTGEALYAFRADQSRRTCDNDLAHHDDFTGAVFSP